MVFSAKCVASGPWVRGWGVIKPAESRQPMGTSAYQRSDFVPPYAPAADAAFSHALLVGTRADAFAAARRTTGVGPTICYIDDGSHTNALETDWNAFVVSGDNEAFISAVIAFTEHVRTSILGMIDRGSLLQTFDEWRDTVGEELDKMWDARWKLRCAGPAARRWHDNLNRLDIILGLAGRMFERGELVALRTALNPPDGSLESIGRILSGLYGKDVDLSFGGIWGVARLSASVRQRTLVCILENLIRNASEHPRSPGERVPVLIALAGNVLTFTDNGADMTPDSLANIRAGVRIHNGAPVSTGMHGFGWSSIRHSCKDLGIGWEIDSTLGVGTTVKLTLPPAFLDAAGTAANIVAAGFVDDGAAGLEFLSTLTPDQKIEAAMQLPFTIDRIDRTARDRLRLVPDRKDDLEEIYAWLDQQIKWFIAIRRIFVSIDKVLEGNEHEETLMAIFSSAAHALISCHTRTCLFIDMLARDEDISSRIAEYLAKDNTVEKVIVDHIGYRVPGVLREITELANWFKRTATRTYADGEDVVFVYDREVGFQDWPVRESTGFRILTTCPPDPNQLMLRTFLRMLGWTLTVEVRGEMVIARLNLGATRITVK